MPDARPTTHSKRWVSPGALERLLGPTASTPPASAFTLYLPPEQIRKADTLDSLPGAEAREIASRILPRLREESDCPCGGVIFASSSASLLVLPPFPVPEFLYLDGWQPEPLLKELQADRTIAAVLLRLGRFAVGVYRGRQLVDSKTDTRFVKGRHRAGGSSQRRFERRREHQARELFDEACQAVRDHLSPFEAELKYLSLGGEAHTVAGFLERCPYLGGLGLTLLPRRLDVRVPNRASLDRVADMIYESQLITVA